MGVSLSHCSSETPVISVLLLAVFHLELQMAFLYQEPDVFDPSQVSIAVCRCFAEVGVSSEEQSDNGIEAQGILDQRGCPLLIVMGYS